MDFVRVSLLGYGLLKTERMAPNLVLPRIEGVDLRRKCPKLALDVALEIGTSKSQVPREQPDALSDI